MTRSHHVEVVVQELLTRRALDDSVIITAGWREAGLVRDEGRSLLHALQDHDHAFVTPETLIVGNDELVLANALGCAEDRDASPSCEVFDPSPVLLGSMRKHLRRDARDAAHLAEEVDDVLRPLQSLVVAAQHDPIPDRVGEIDNAGKEL